MATVSSDEFHEITASSENNDVRHSKPNDRSECHVWIFEPSTARGVLTQDGITQIAYHKYKAGSYTALDNLMNPTWNYLTSCLPLNMAPNLVTAIGSLFCLASYILTWRYTPNFDQLVPNWLLYFNAFCVISYYTLDCMDGKQARRTGSSSPLGQLFDHGVDCVCLLAHLSGTDAWLMTGGSKTFYIKQAFLQFSFFVAQWEEYYTGVLPHSNGQIGVTEVTYGFAVIYIANAFVDRVALYKNTSAREVLRNAGVDIEKLADKLHIDISVDYRLQDVFSLGWALMMAFLILLSMRRVLVAAKTPKTKLSAVSKLVTPLLVAFAPLALPEGVAITECRFVHLAIGLCLVLLTIKLIVFSMARQAYAMIQLDALPCLLAILWIRNDERLTDHGIHLLWQVLTVWYLIRIIQWTTAAINQICERLAIRLFVITNSTEHHKEK